MFANFCPLKTSLKDKYENQEVKKSVKAVELVRVVQRIFGFQHNSPTLVKTDETWSNRITFLSVDVAFIKEVLFTLKDLRVNADVQLDFKRDDEQPLITHVHKAIENVSNRLPCLRVY